MLSSCTTLDSLWSGTSFTYNCKTNKLSAKTKVNKHLTIKY